MCDGAPNAPSRSSLKAECEVGHQNFFTDLPGNSRLGSRWWPLESQRMTMLSLLFCSLPVLVDDDVVVRGLIWVLLLSLLLRFWWAWGDWRVAGVKELWDCWVEFVEVLWVVCTSLVLSCGCGGAVGLCVTHCCCCIVCSCVLVSSSSLSSVWPCCSLLASSSLTLLSSWRSSLLSSSRCLTAEQSCSVCCTLWWLVRFNRCWRLLVVSSLKRKKSCSSSAMLSFKTFILGDAGVLVCPCVLELGSVMVTEVVPASSSAWLFTSGSFLIFWTSFLRFRSSSGIHWGWFLVPGPWLCHCGKGSQSALCRCLLPGWVVYLCWCLLSSYMSCSSRGWCARMMGVQ